MPETAAARVPLDEAWRTETAGILDVESATALPEAAATDVAGVSEISSRSASHISRTRRAASSPRVRAAAVVLVLGTGTGASVVGFSTSDEAILERPRTAAVELVVEGSASLLPGSAAGPGTSVREVGSPLALVTATTPAGARAAVVVPPDRPIPAPGSRITALRPLNPDGGEDALFHLSEETILPARDPGLLVQALTLSCGLPLAALLALALWTLPLRGRDPEVSEVLTRRVDVDASLPPAHDSSEDRAPVQSPAARVADARASTLCARHDRVLLAYGSYETSLVEVFTRPALADVRRAETSRFHTALAAAAAARSVLEIAVLTTDPAQVEAALERYERAVLELDASWLAADAAATLHGQGAAGDLARPRWERAVALVRVAEDSAAEPAERATYLSRALTEVQGLLTPPRAAVAEIRSSIRLALPAAQA